MSTEEIIVWSQIVTECMIWAIHKSIRTFGYNIINSNHTSFLKKKKGNTTVFNVYVDDMVVTGDDHVEWQALQSYLRHKFEMEDLVPLKYLLDIEVADSKNSIFPSQRKYENKS